MTDIECPQCGHRALSVATRCPRCGHEFASDLLRPLPPIPNRAWLRPTLAVAGAAAVVVALALLARGSGGGGASAPTPENAPPAPVATPSVDTAPPAPVAVAPTVPLPAAVPAPSGRAGRRYATNWVNVREYRGMGGPSVLVLKPGDSVLVDSLRRGWYRVVDGGRTVGYAHRRFLAAARPDAVAP